MNQFIGPPLGGVDRRRWPDRLGPGIGSTAAYLLAAVILVGLTGLLPPDPVGGAVERGPTADIAQGHPLPVGATGCSAPWPSWSAG